MAISSPNGLAATAEWASPNTQRRFPENRHARLGAPTAIRTAWSSYPLFLIKVARLASAVSAERPRLHGPLVLNYYLLRLDCPCVWISVRLDEHLINFGHSG